MTALHIESDTKAPQDGCQCIVMNPWFEAVCGIIILLDVVCMTVQGQHNIEYALAHIGGGAEAASGSVFQRLSKVFIGFYCAELVMRIWACRCRDFFMGPRWQLNLFDLVLVLGAIYELVEELALIGLPLSASAGQTWLRLLRLAKMVKMLRVVRFMRLFRELRMIITAVSGSLMALLWSCVAIFLATFVFSLCFLTGISTYVVETPTELITDSTLDGIENHWSSVPMAILTLFMAITGGSDWEHLAEPLRAAGLQYFLLFLGFIVFMSLAVLNVVLGRFVDHAISVALQDAQDSLEDAMCSPEVEAFRDYVISEHAEQSTGSLNHSAFLVLLKSNNKAVLGFLRVLGLRSKDAQRVFRELSQGNSVTVRDFIQGCLRFERSQKEGEVATIAIHTKRFTQQFVVVMEYIEDEFGRMRDVFEGMGLPLGDVPRPLEERLVDARCLPAQWRQG